MDERISHMFLVVNSWMAAKMNCFCVQMNVGKKGGGGRSMVAKSFLHSCMARWLDSWMGGWMAGWQRHKARAKYYYYYLLLPLPLLLLLLLRTAFFVFMFKRDGWTMGIGDSTGAFDFFFSLFYFKCFRPF